MKKYFKEFIHENDGMEMLQVAIIILIAAMLAGVIITMSQSVKDKIKDAQTQVEGITIPAE